MDRSYWGGSGDDATTSLALDSYGNVYWVGYYSNTVDFDTGTGTDMRTSVGSNDAFLSKYSASGNYEWTRAFGGVGFDTIYSVLVDGVGNVIVGGFFQYTVDFEPGPGMDTRSGDPTGYLGSFLSKYDSSAVYQWTKTLGETSSVISSVAVDGSDNVYVGGWFQATVDFNPGIGIDTRTSAGSSDGFLTKYAYDATTPSLSVAGSTMINTTSLNYEATATDTQAIILSIEYQIDGMGGTWTYCPAQDGTFDELEEIATCSLSSLTEGSHTIYFRATDSAQNTPSASSASLIVDTIAPGVPAIIAPPTGRATSDSTPTLSGTTEANATVTVYRNGESEGTTVADGSGSWSFTPSSHWPDGNYNLTATASDAAGNASGASSPVAVEIDTGVPAVPALAVSDWGDRTDELRPSFSGTGEVGQVVKVWLNNNMVATVMVDQTGHWSWTPGSDFPVGSYLIAFSVSDQAGNESTRSSEKSFQVVDDYDEDGLTTSQEAMLGTDPHDADSDEDGLDDGREEGLGTNPMNRDTDSDGSKDGEEQVNGTNPLDRGSALMKRNTTLCSDWNGFLGMWNVLEHINTGARKLNVESRLNDIFGHGQGVFAFGLKSGYQYDLLVHNMSGHQENSYGLVCSNATNGQPGDLDGSMVYYKPDLSTGGYQYAFSMPLGNGLSGTQYVLYNTYQPSLDPADTGNLAANWIQLTNLSIKKQTGTLVFYNREGSEIARQAVTLEAGARYDFSAHDLAGLRTIGMVEWSPTRSDAPFQLRNLRYYYRADGVSVPLGDEFDSALQLEGVVGSGQLLTVPLDAENSSSVLEMANTLNEELKVEVIIYAASGGSALHHQTYKLKPHATFHLITDSILRGGQGIAIIKGNKITSIIATAMQYGRTETLGINTVYGIQASEPLGTIMRGSYNTYLKQGCRLLMANPTDHVVKATISMKRYDGTKVELGRLLAIPAYGLTDYDLCREDQENVYGVVTVQPENSNTIFATVLRIGENEQYRFPTPVRE